MGKSTRWRLVSLVAVLAVVVAGAVWLALGIGSSGETRQTTRPGEPDFDILDEIFAILERDFVDSELVDPETLRTAAIEAVLEALGDPHTIYIDPERVEQGLMPGMLQGIGAQVEHDPATGNIVIVTPFSGSPAEEAGVRPGDTILAVDGEPTDGWSVAQAVDRIRGLEGTRVRLTVEHADGEVEELTIERATVVIPSVVTRPLEDADGVPLSDIAYIELQQFTDEAVEELAEALEAVARRGYEGLILDLRRNPGGSLGATVKIADMFLGDGIILTQVNGDGSERVFEAEPGGEATDIPLVVLVGPGSASGAEVLAGALRDNGRAVLLGEMTFGKGTVNLLRDLSDGGALFVSIARWLTPSGEQIQGVGLEPDIVVALTDEERQAGVGPQLLGAIDYLRGEVATRP
jgi:carboxyl-terminal processing protease